jgi:hypothetical protein
MKNIISKASRRILTILSILILNNSVSRGQEVLQPGNLSIPLAPGDRELIFSVPLDNASADNVEVWVFYSKKQSDLNTINSGSFTSSFHYGRAIMLKSASQVDCHFVFPHSFHSISPNADLFCSYKNSGRTDLVSAGFPSCSLNLPDISGIIGIGTDRNNSVKIDFNPWVAEKGECVFFRVFKRVKSGNTYTNESVSSIRKFRMPDSFNIGIAGDSYGAGEGAPNKEFDVGDDGEGLWISCPCHRSKKSGLLRGVKKFIDRNPEVAVDYSFVACSGAVTQNLGESEQVTPDFRVSLYNECGSISNPKQFETIRDELIGNNQKHDEMQMLLMSIGGNNSGFGDIVVNYLLEPRNLALENILPGLLSEYTDRIDGLDEDYSNVNEKINDFFPEVRPIIGLSAYPNPTVGLSGRCGCNGIMNAGYTCALYENDCMNSPRAEYELIHSSFIVPLNEKVRETADLFRWNIIDNINAGNHGLCNCEEPYFNLIGTSYDQQGDIYGLVHPNGVGYREMYKDRVFGFVNTKYRDYKALYYLAILFGIKTAPADCPDPLTLRSIALNGVLRNAAILNAFSGLPIILSQLNSKEVKSLAYNNDGKGVSTNPVIKKWEADRQVRSSLMNNPVGQAIIKPTAKPRPLHPVKPFGKNISKVKADLKTYLASAEFKTRVETLKKTPKTKAKDNDPLDNRYNKYK